VDTRDKSVRDRAREAERYREAAALALDQLQWSVNYLHRIRKSTIAERLDRNREQILANFDAPLRRVRARRPHRE
jgi:hypothetical protein